MLTVIAVLIFTQLFLTFSTNYLDNATELNIRQQEKLIGLQMASFINETNSLSDGNTSITYILPWIYEGNKPSGQDCNILLFEETIDDEGIQKIEGRIKVDYIREGKSIGTIQKIAFIPNGLIYSADENFFCGAEFKYYKVRT
ncbi:MAG: hypothetical protein Q7S21_07920 [archaeon]|nr:hypothetical protein [archaeon]